MWPGDPVVDGHPDADDAADLVARLRARLAEHEAEGPRGRRRPARRRRVRRRGWSRRRRVELVVGAMAVGVAVLAVMMMARTASPPPARPASGAVGSRPTTTARAHATAPATRPGARLLDLLPRSWRSTCQPTRETTATARAGQPLSALTCAPAAGIVVAVWRDPAPATDRRLDGMIAGTPERLHPGPCSPDGAPGSWSTARHPRQLEGRVVCAISDRGAQLVWSVDRAGLLLRADRSDGDMARLFSWWVGSTF